MEKFYGEKKLRKSDYLPQSEAEWLEMGQFNIENIKIDNNDIRCAFIEGMPGKRLTVMSGGIPRDPERRKKLPLINKLYGHLALRLSHFNESSLLYNQPATGGSSGDLEKETIESRTKVLADVTKYFADRSSSKEVSLVGTSAAGYMALSAIESLESQGFTVSKLVLLSPADYPVDIEQVPYGEKFSASLREPWNISESPAFSRLEKYIKNGGSAHVTFFEIDNPPIPQDIQKHYQELVDNLADSGGDITLDIIPGVSHNFRRINSEESKSIVNNDSIRQTTSSLVDFLEK